MGMDIICIYIKDVGAIDLAIGLICLVIQKCYSVARMASTKLGLALNQPWNAGLSFRS